MHYLPLYIHTHIFGSMFICAKSYLTGPPTNVQPKLEAPYSDFREIFVGLLVLRGLAALVGYHAFRRWTPCGQPGAASRFFCGGKLRLALLAGHLNLSTPSHSERSGPNFSSRKSCIYDFRSGREVEESLLGLAKRLAPAEELNFNSVCVTAALLGAAPALASG
jgi:hypothetical protein